MARPIKDGVDYFPKDTDFYSDDKVRLLRAEFGAKGMYILDYLLCDIYGKNGYFTKWDKNRCFLVSDGAGCGCSPEYISEFVSGCCRCSFFDERVLNVFGVLTSAGIQRRYIRMFNSRDEIQMIQEYWLLNTEDKKDVPACVLRKLAFKHLKNTENPNKSTGNPDKSTGNAQSKKKVKDTNVSQKKEKEKVNIPPEIADAFEGFAEMRKKKGKALTDYSTKLILSKLQKLAGDDYSLQRQILDQSTLNSWQGVFPLKEDKPNGGAENGQAVDDAPKERTSFASLVV